MSILGHISSIIFNHKTSVVGFDDVLFAMKHMSRYIFINTMPLNMQNVLIPNTVSCTEEETTINDIIVEYNTTKYTIIVYGKNACDETTSQKYDQLRNIGFSDIHVYPGGMFEYLLLNDIYGGKTFPLSVSSGRDIHSSPIDIFIYSPQERILSKTI
jgi:hypothetical protein